MSERSFDSLQGLVVLTGRILSAVRNSRLYPDGHPILEKLLDDAFFSIDSRLRDEERLEFRIAGNVLIVNGKPFKESTKVTFSEFITLLGTRQIALLAFLRGIDRDEFISFLNILALESEELEKVGGFSAELRRRDIQHIVSKDISYESGEQKGITLEWGDFYSLLSAPEELKTEISRAPESVADLIMKATAAESSGDEEQWANSALNVLQKIADSLFEAYGRTQPDEYAQGLARIALSLNPSLQRLLIDAKADQDEWSRVVEVMISRIPDERLVDIVAGRFEQEKQEVSGTTEVEAQGQIVNRIQGLLRKVFTDPERKKRLIPILRKKLAGAGLTDEGWRSLLTRTAPESHVSSLLEAELSGRPPLSADTLVTMKMALNAKAGIEELIHPFITSIREDNPETRKYVSEKLRAWAGEIISLGRYDLIDKIIEELSAQLRTEDALDVYESLVVTLRDIAVALLRKEKRSHSERITGAFADYLSAVKDQPQGEMLTAALGEIGDKTALRELVSLLGSTELDKEAARWIIKAGSSALQPLLWALRIVEDKNTRLRIVDILARLGDEALPDITHELKDSRWYVRRNACTVLSRMPECYPLKPLHALIRDEYPQVRSEAIAAAGNMGGEEAENLILSAMNDKDYSVQTAALEGLAKIGGEKTVTALISYLQTASFRGRKQELGKAALRTLGAIGGEPVREFLQEILEKKSWGRYKYPEAVRRESIETLGRLGGVTSRVILLRAANDKSEAVKTAALVALQNLSHKQKSTP